MSTTTSSRPSTSDAGKAAPTEKPAAADATTEPCASNGKSSRAGSLVSDVRKVAVDSTFAVVGVTDIAVERLKGCTGKIDEVRQDISSRTVKGEIRKLQQTVTELPSAAVERGLGVAGKAEKTLDQLAQRGRVLMDRVAHQDSTQAFIEQVNSTISRGKAAFTATKNGAGDVAESAKDVVEQTSDAVAESVVKTTNTAKSAAKKTAKKATKKAASARSAAKGAATSARKSAAAASKAAADVVDIVGDEESVEKSAKKPAEKKVSADS